jgi:hypothetical protein
MPQELNVRDDVSLRISNKGSAVSVEKEKEQASDYCPHCIQLLEIAALNFKLFRPPIALFVCPGCGLTKAETRAKAPINLRGRVALLERLLTALKGVRA